MKSGEAQFREVRMLHAFVNEMIGIPFLLTAAMVAPQRADESADKIIVRCSTQLRNAKTLSGTYTLRASGTKTFAGTVDFILEKDSKLVLEGKNTKEVFDGKIHLVADKNKKTYNLRDPRTSGIPYQVGFEGFTNIKGSPVMSFLDPKRSEMRTVDGSKVVAVTGSDRVVYISPESALPFGVSMMIGGTRYEIRFSNVVLNPVVQSGAFETVVPGDYTFVPYVSPSMIKVGIAASQMDNPAQEVVSANIKESEKQVLIFTNNNVPSRETISTLNRFATDLDDQRIGFTVIAQNGKPSGMDRTNKALKFVNDTAMGQNQIATAYGVTQFPSIIVVDRNGKVLHRQVGSETDFLLRVIR
jgi:outer membrane lipoprotein-sorting protein